MVEVPNVVWQSRHAIEFARGFGSRLAVPTRHDEKLEAQQLAEGPTEELAEQLCEQPTARRLAEKLFEEPTVVAD